MTQTAPPRTIPRTRALPVAPNPDRVRLQPLDLTESQLTEGPWSRWQHDNRSVSIPHGRAWIERDGVLDNFRRLIGESDAPERRGWVFCDSDLYKMLEAAAWDLARGPHGPSEAFIEEAAALIARTREDDGYVNTFVQAGLETRFGNLARGHELYCAGHLIQAALAEVRTTGRETLLALAVPFADALVAEFLDGERDDTDGHPEIEMALVELSRHTGERRYLELARRLIEVRGHGVLGPGLFGSAYFQDDVPVRERHDVAGHAVRALYLLSGIVDVAVETEDPELLEVAEAQWSSMLNGKTYLTGAVGSRFEGEAFGDRYELPPDLVYGETCASIAAFMASWRLLLATGRSRYADLMERVLSNVFAGSTSLGRDRFFYVNPVHRRRPQRAVPAGEKPIRTDAPGERAEWFDVACCPPNIMRTVASLGGYLATRSDAGVQLHLYVPAVIETTVATGAVRIELVTEYPADGRVHVRVLEAPDGEWTLALRIPDWADGFRVRLRGTELEMRAGDDGYARVDRVWAEGDELELELPVRPRLTVSHPSVDAVRGTVAIERGPVVYCLERPSGADSTDPEAFELEVDAPLVERWDPDLLGGVPIIEASGVLRDDRDWDGSGWATLGSQPGSRFSAATAAAIPYALWANRGPSQMRVWIPTVDRDATGSAQGRR